jgi:hypothetical protein
MNNNIIKSQQPENYEFGVSWGLANIWNRSLGNREERPVEPRSRLWASELGKSPIDLFLKLKGVKPSNPFDARSLAKFEAGNIWEGVLTFVLHRAGLLKSTQDYITYQYPGLLPVTGKLDILAGGAIDWEQARNNAISLQNELSKFPGFDNAVKRAVTIVDYLSQEYPDGLNEVIFEIKSSASMVFDKLLATQQPQKEHKMQNFHYLKGTGRKEGHILYISKDDSRMLEFGVMNPSGVEDEYRNAIEFISKAYFSDTMPEKDKELSFNEETMRFEASWKVMYSSYLTYLYGYKDQGEFRAKYEKPVASWNRVFKRCVSGANMTKLNLEVIEEVKKYFPNFDDLVMKAKGSNVINSEEEGEE